jgi:tetratricopeptide (TPR) repeat protein
MKISALMLLVMLPATAWAQHAKHAHETLGTVNFRNSGNAAAQPQFQRGVALLHSFEYGDAAEAFRAAQRADASLALAYWLEALTYSHVLWGEEELEKSRAVLARLGSTPAARLQKAKTPTERTFGAAVEAFFADHPLPVRARAFADSLQRLATDQPQDQEAAAFASLASMMAWYGGARAAGDGYYDRVQQHALRVFRDNPQHPGAAHYLIHFVDMNPKAAREALQFARAYDKIAPDAEHALHMPSHVYLPLGLWEDVAASNERAWAASRRELISKRLPAEDNSWHSLEWLQYAYLQSGKQQQARALIDTAYSILKGATISDDNPDARNVVNVLAFRYALETGAWDAYPGGVPDIDVVLKQPRPNQRAWSMATTAAYQAAVAALRARNDASVLSKVMNVFLTTPDSSSSSPRSALLQRLSKQLNAMAAHAGGDTERAITLLREIAPHEPANASLPPGIVPSYELLGDYLLAAGRHAEAAEAYQRALDARANRASPMRGLHRAKAAAR